MSTDADDVNTEELLALQRSDGGPMFSLADVLAFVVARDDLRRIPTELRERPAEEDIDPSVRPTLPVPVGVAA